MPSARQLSRRGLIAFTLGTVSVGVYAATCGRGQPPGAVGSREPMRLPGRSKPVAAGPLRRTPAASPTGASRTAPAASMSGPAPFGPAPDQLPRGGRVVLPVYRLVGFCGVRGAPALGRLGIGDLDARVRELERLGTAYAAGRPVMPVLEFIAVVAQSRPGTDGRYRARADPAVVRDYLDAARRHRALLLLNVQPGRARFIDEVRALESWLREPDVGLALDPEWAVLPGQVPGRVFGRMTGQEIDQVAGYLASLVTAGELPEKVLVVHQLAPHIIRNLSTLRHHPGVTVIKSVDGIGPPAAKTNTWRRLVGELPAGMRPGFKLFFNEDSTGASRLMTPSEVLALRPVPDYVMYE